MSTLPIFPLPGTHSRADSHTSDSRISGRRDKSDEQAAEPTFPEPTFGYVHPEHNGPAVHDTKLYEAGTETPSKVYHLCNRQNEPRTPQFHRSVPSCRAHQPDLH